MTLREKTTQDMMSRSTTGCAFCSGRTGNAPLSYVLTSTKPAQEEPSRSSLRKHRISSGQKPPVKNGPNRSAQPVGGRVIIPRMAFSPSCLFRARNLLRLRGVPFSGRVYLTGALFLLRFLYIVEPYSGNSDFVLGFFYIVEAILESSDFIPESFYIVEAFPENSAFLPESSYIAEAFLENSAFLPESFYIAEAFPENSAFLPESSYIAEAFPENSVFLSESFYIAEAFPENSVFLSESSYIVKAPLVTGAFQ